jgi:hypothetical protein
MAKTKIALIAVVRYVVLNPVRAHMAERPEVRRVRPLPHVTHGCGERA